MFDENSTTDDVLSGVDLRGRRFLVTGVSAGLGVETARALAARGADLVGTARDLGKAQAAAAPAFAAAEAGGGSLTLVSLDLASLASVRACADALQRDGRPFHGIVANAGVLGMPFGRTVDGFETHIGVNHLGHFVLVNRVASLLAPGGRLVNLSASGHAMADIDLDDLNFERTPYVEVMAYNRTKTANILFAVEFDRRHRERGVRATAVHPGVITTELGRNMSPELMGQLLQLVEEHYHTGGQLPWKYKTVPQGAATSVWAAAVAPADEIGGRYCEDCHVAHVTDDPAAANGVRPYALDGERAKTLWMKSEALVGERF